MLPAVAHALAYLIRLANTKSIDQVRMTMASNWFENKGNESKGSQFGQVIVTGFPVSSGGNVGRVGFHGPTFCTVSQGILKREENGPDPDVDGIKAVIMTKRTNKRDLDVVVLSSPEEQQQNGNSDSYHPKKKIAR